MSDIHISMVIFKYQNGDIEKSNCEEIRGKKFDRHCLYIIYVTLVKLLKEKTCSLTLAMKKKKCLSVHFC